MGDLARGCINAQLYIVPRIGLSVVWTGRSIGKDFRAEGSNIQFAFPCGAKVSYTGLQLHRLGRVHIDGL